MRRNVFSGIQLVSKWEGTILSDSTNKSFYLVAWLLWPQIWNLIVTQCKHSSRMWQLPCSLDRRTHAGSAGAKICANIANHAYLPCGCETLMGLGACRTAHVVRDPSVWLHINCFPSWCHEMDFRGSADWQRISAVLVLRSHKTIWPVSYPISNYMYKEKQHLTPHYQIITQWHHKFLCRMVSSGMLRRVALVRTNVSEELSASFIRVTRIGD
jgi:hypothetical protein